MVFITTNVCIDSSVCHIIAFQVIFIYQLRPDHPVGCHAYGCHPMGGAVDGEVRISEELVSGKLIVRIRMEEVACNQLFYLPRLLIIASFHQRTGCEK